MPSPAIFSSLTAGQAVHHVYLSYLSRDQTAMQGKGRVLTIGPLGKLPRHAVMQTVGREDAPGRSPSSSPLQGLESVLRARGPRHSRPPSVCLSRQRESRPVSTSAQDLLRRDPASLSLAGTRPVFAVCGHTMGCALDRGISISVG